MTTQTIEVEGLPEGWKAKEFRLGEIDETYYDPATKSICRLLLGSTVGVLIVEKIQPRRIVLEETGEERKICYGEWYETSEHKLMRWPYGGKTDGRHKVWREVKENDLSLTNAEHKLSLSVDQCRKLFCNLDKDVMKLLREFIKDK